MRELATPVICLGSSLLMLFSIYENYIMAVSLSDWGSGA